MEEKTLTKEEAIKNHRLMWNWISEESLKRKRGVTKEEAFEHFKWKPIVASCWCCEYALDRSSDDPCSVCPLRWPDNRCSKPAFIGGLYDKYLDALYSFENDYLKASEIAKQIAELPERK